MGSPKDELISLLGKLPDDASYEDIQYHLYVLEKIKRGLDRAEAEGGIPHEAAETRLGKWLTGDRAIIAAVIHGKQDFAPFLARVQGKTET